MGEMAILFDGSRCTACQACVIACKQAKGLPLAPEPGNEAVADAYERLADLDGSAPLAIALNEREVAGAGLVWETARRGCVRCAEAPCGQACPTGALELGEDGVLAGPAADRCVSCGLCAMVCPTGVPHSTGGVGPVRLCDGCAAEVAAGSIPACVGACPADALFFGEREDVLARANDRTVVLRDRGFQDASVLGVSEQGGHGVVQVLKYGVQGHVNEPFATTEELPWIAGAKLAGPVSVAVLAAGAAGAGVALAREANRARRERSEAMRAVAAAGAPVWEQLGDGVVLAPDAAAADDAESVLDAALRRRDALRARASVASPAAAAVAAAAAMGEESHLVPVAFDGTGIPVGVNFGDADDPVDEGVVGEGDDFNAAEDAPCVDDSLSSASAIEGDTGEIPLVGNDTDEIPSIDGNTGEIPCIDDASDTGELYDAEDFRRLLAADIVAHHLAKKAAVSEGEGEGDSADGEGAPSEDAPNA